MGVRGESVREPSASSTVSAPTRNAGGVAAKVGGRGGVTHPVHVESKSDSQISHAVMGGVSFCLLWH